MARVLRCDEGDYDAVAGTCAAPVWTEDNGMLPPLSAADAMQIAAGIATLWIIGHIIRQLRKSTER